MVRQSHQRQHTTGVPEAIKDFMEFTGIQIPEEFSTVTRAHVIAWRDDLGHRILNGTTIRHRLSALSSLFDYLCDHNAVTHNPVKGVKRPKVESAEGRTPALGDHQARTLLVRCARRGFVADQERPSGIGHLALSRAAA